MLSLDELRKKAELATSETVVAAFIDMHGRLIGASVEAEDLLDQVVDHGVEGCKYLALDMEVDPLRGYEIANCEKSYRDFGIAPELATLSPHPLTRPHGVGVVRHQPRLVAGSSPPPTATTIHKNRVVAYQTHPMGLMDLNATIVAPRPTPRRRGS